MKKKRKTKVLFFTDLHLGATIEGYDLRGDQRKVLEAVEMESMLVDLVVFGGDLFHSRRPPPWATAMALDFAGKLSCPAVFVKGNHDEDPKDVDALEPLRAVNFDPSGSDEITWAGMMSGAMEVAQSSVFCPECPGVLEFNGSAFLVVGNISNHKAREVGFGSAQEAVDLAFKAALKVGPSLKAAFCHLSVDGAKEGGEAAFTTGGDLAMPMEMARKLHCPVLNGHQHLRQKIGNVRCVGSAVQTDFGSVEPTGKNKCYAVLEF